MDSPEAQKPEVRPELNKTERKKGGWLANLLAKLGFGGGSGAGGLGGIGAAGGAGGGGLSGLFSTGLLATKTGMMVAALVGTTVAGGIGMLGYKALSGEGGSSGGPRDEFSSLFAPKPKADAKAEDAKPAGGVSDSLSMMAQANGGGGLEGADKAPEEAKPAEAAPAAAPAVNTNQGVDHGAAAPAAASSLPIPGGKLNAKKIGALDGGGGGGSSGARSGPAGVAGSPQALLASARAGNTSGLKAGQARAMLSANRGRRFDTGRGAGKQLLAASRDSGRGGNFRSTGLTMDNSSLGDTFETEGGSEGGITSGKEGAKDKPLSVNPNTTNPDQPPDVPDEVPPRDVTPWKDELKLAKTMTWTCIISLLLATLLLQHYYKLWVDGVNAFWTQSYAKSFKASATVCQAKMATAITTAGLQCGGVEATAAVAAVEASVDATYATMETVATKAAGVLTKSQTEAVAASAAPGSLAAITATSTQTTAGAAVAETDKAAMIAKAKAGTTAAEGKILAAVTKAGTPCCKASAAAATVGAKAVLAACEAAAAKAATAGSKAWLACMEGFNTANVAQCQELAVASAEAGASWAKNLGRLLGGVAIAAGAMMIKCGATMMQGEYSQDTQGQALILGGALMAGVSAWFMLEATTAEMPKAAEAQAAAMSGKLEVGAVTQMGTFTSLPMVMQLAGVAGLMAGASVALGEPDTVPCKAPQDCDKIEDEGEARLTPGYGAAEFLAFDDPPKRSKFSLDKTSCPVPLEPDGRPEDGLG